MIRTLVVGGIAVMLIATTASRAAAAPAIDIFPGTFGGSGVRVDGGMPGEQQYGSYGIHNPGTTTLTVSNMTITGPAASFITFADARCDQPTTCPHAFTVAPGGYEFVSVSCVAPEPGTFAAALTVASDAATGTGTASLTCKGFHTPVLQVTPETLDFGTQHICWRGDACGPSCATQPATQTLTITNAAAEPSELDLTAALPPSGPFDSFVISGADELSYGIVAGQSVTVTLSYHAAPPGNYNFDGPVPLTPIYPAGLAAVDVAVHAHGGSGRLEIDNSQLLGIGPVGQPLTASFTGHSTGDSCLDLDEAWFMGPITVIDPQIDHQHPRLLQAGEAITWQVSCTPTQVLPTCDTFTVNWAYDDPESGASYDFCCAGAGGALLADPFEVWFGNSEAVAIGSSATKRVRVSNAGNQPTDLTAITSSDPHFTIALASGALPVTLAPGAETYVDVTFTPTDTTRAFATLLLDGSNGDDYTLYGAGDGVVVATRVTPSAHDFGTVALPAAPSQDFQLANLGQTTVTVLAVTLDLPNDFAVIGLAAGATLAPDATLTFSVRATASTLGVRDAMLTVDLDGAPDLAIPLQAIATDPALVVTTSDATPTDASLELGSLDVDVGPRTGHVALHNAGAAPIVLASCVVTGAPELSLATACPLAIPAGGDADLAVAFAPTAEADVRGALRITGSGFATGALRIGLHGTGLDQHVAVSAMTVAFGDTFRRPPSPDHRVVTVRNTAATDLVITATTVDGEGFALVGAAPSTIAPGQAIELAIAFAPAMIGDFVGHLTIGNADDPQIARVELVGRGVARELAIAPLAVDLGNITVGTTVRLGALQPDAITIRNTSARAFAISSVTLTGDPAFQRTGATPGTLAPGDSAQLDVSFAPTAPGSATAELALFADGDPEPVARIAITASAVTARPPAAGGCSAGGSASPWTLALGAALLVGRRRRRGSDASRSLG